MGKLTTHILDTACGKPGVDISIELFCLNPSRQIAKKVKSNIDGRTEVPLLEGKEFKTGVWELVFGIGEYYLTVTDDNGCVVYDTVNMYDNSDLKIKPAVLDEIKCYGRSSGSANAHASKGVAPYTFEWSPNQCNDSIATGLIAGTYYVTVTDADSCKRTDSIILKQPVAPITFSIKDTVPINCYDSCTGSITVYNLQGGDTASNDYSYLLLKNGLPYITSDTTKIDNICEGVYEIKVRDNINMCSGGDYGFGTIIRDFKMIQPPELVIDSFSVHNASCNANESDGSISINNISGGTSPYTYLWSNGKITKDISDLSPDNYSLTVTDKNNCIKTGSATVDAETSVYVFAGIYLGADTDTTICPGTSIRLYADGTSPDSLIWTPADLIQGRNDTITPLVLPRGDSTTYYVKVYKGTCYNTDSITIGLYPLIQVYAGEDTTVYKGTEVHLLASGATDSTSYTWSGMNIITNPDTISPVVSPQQDTSVYVVVATTGICSTSDSVMIFVLDKTSSFGFTPNGDGYNDTWKFPIIGKVQIFNRWGEKVYETSSGMEWNGENNKGKQLPIGTYYYVIISNDLREPATGIVTILR